MQGVAGAHHMQSLEHSLGSDGRYLHVLAGTARVLAMDVKVNVVWGHDGLKRDNMNCDKVF